jgi:hypothetical protein
LGDVTLREFEKGIGMQSKFQAKPFVLTFFGSTCPEYIVQKVYSLQWIEIDEVKREQSLGN